MTMNREEQMLCRHLMDLAETCYRRDIPIFSDFLSLYEQSLFHQYVAGGLPPVDFCLDGGYEYAERKILAFEPAGAGYHIPASFCALEILPLQAKFSEDLTHRDYLGALIHLGLDRSGIGDILPMDKSCVVFCTAPAADLICRELTRIRHTSVHCVRTDRESFEYSPHFEDIRGTVASVRLDSVLALAFSGSRSRLVGLIEGEKVFVNGRLVNSNAYRLSPGDVVSVRGFGKFIYQQEVSQTKKGRYLILIQKFI
ncbi:RNA-binding protein YlmH [Cuneatibacter caecimuris]|uniref:RNA-binding protein YlmH n=2 Tax=Cuneatibacter caecimuris TaxID=1796618 RepID=A0A4Q7NZL3_9FIRM|nr:RNA-binding protein YlmH [Cuneatibacter caecimuris]